jgi:transcriptional regulator with XRE-family HTH domain
MVKRYHTALARRLGQKLAHYRRRAGFTQEQLAESVEVEVATISRYETGATLPSLVTLEALAALLHTTIADLLAEEAPQRTEEGERVLAILEPLPFAERRVMLEVLSTLGHFLRGRTTMAAEAFPSCSKDSG